MEKSRNTCAQTKKLFKQISTISNTILMLSDCTLKIHHLPFKSYKTICALIYEYANLDSFKSKDYEV